MEQSEDIKLSFLEIIEFEDDQHLTEFLTDYEDEEYIDILSRKVLSYIYSDGEEQKINLFIAQTDIFQSLVYIYARDMNKILDKLMNFYIKTEDYNVCLVLQEAKEIFNNRKKR